MKHLKKFTSFNSRVSKELEFASEMGLLNSFRPGSDKFYKVLQEAKINKDKLNLSYSDNLLLETDIGEKALSKNTEVPLDLPLTEYQNKKYELLFENTGEFDISSELSIGEVVIDGSSDRYQVFSIEEDKVKLKPLDFPGKTSNFPMDFGEDVEMDEFWMFFEQEDYLLEAEYRGREVELESPKRGGPKKFYVYVKNPETDRVNKVTFGAKDGGQELRVKLDDPEARENYSKRHGCEDGKHDDKLKPGYWSCRLPRYWHIINPDQEKMDALWW
jgi:hypothetical protein